MFNRLVVAVFVVLLSCQTPGGGAKVVRNRGPGIWGAEGNKRIALVAEVVIGPEQYPEGFGHVLKVQSDEMGNIYVLDILNGRVLRFDSTGQFQRAIGQGTIKGPPDFHVGRSGAIYVADMGARPRQVEVFDSSGLLRNSFASPVLPYGVREYTEGNILVVGPERGRVFHVCDSTGNVLKSFGTQGKPIRADVRAYMPVCILDRNGRLCSFDENRYEITVYDTKNRVQLRTTREDVPSPRIFRNPSGIGYYKTWGSNYIDVADNGMIVNAFHYVEDGESRAFMDFFDGNGRLLTSCDITGLGSGMMVDANRGKLFVMSREEPRRITRYGFQMVDSE